MEQKTYLWEYLKNTKKNIVIYGMGDGCDKILKVCREKGILIKGIFASDEYVRGKTVHSFPVTTFQEAKDTFGDMIVLLAFGVFRPDMMEKIRRMANETEFYAPEVPLFGGGLLDREFVLGHKEEIDSVRGFLSDETSKKAFDGLFSYKISGKIDPLMEIETDRIQDLKTLVPFREGDFYVDLGAYDGDTVLEWHENFPKHGKILAVEPGRKTFQKLMKNCGHIPGFQAIEAAAWNENTPLSFNGKSGRSAAVASDGKDLVEGICLSDVCTKADFIKFDVEGAEKEAIEGARELIQREKPTLCISCYHRTEDFFALPLQIKKILPEYRVYLRHWPYIPAWDTVYFFVAR